MITAGIDIGSSAAKCVLLMDGNIVGSSIIPTGLDSASTGETVFKEALLSSGISRKNIGTVVATGYGRINVPFASKHITEISCHARGINSVFPNVRTVLDMGGQDVKVIRITQTGHVQKFLMNDKCAAGTGRYLERVADMLNIPLDEFGEASLNIIKAPASISGFCTVFAQQDVISLLRKGEHPNDIAAGICDGLIERIITLIERIGLEEEFAITGGIAKNIGVVKRLENKLGVTARIAPDPQIIGALGAAFLAASINPKELLNCQGDSNV